MATLTLSKTTRTQETRSTDVEPYRRTTRPAERDRTIREDVAAQLTEWLQDHDDDTQARIVGRFRL